MSPAHDIAQKLASGGLGALGGTSPFAIFVALEPELPDSCITLYDTGGEDSDTDEMNIEYPTIQVRVRATSYMSAAGKAREIKTLLMAGELVVGNRRYVGFKVTSDIASIGTTERNRHVLVASYRAILEMET